MTTRLILYEYFPQSGKGETLLDKLIEPEKGGTRLEYDFNGKQRDENHIFKGIGQHIWVASSRHKVSPSILRREDPLNLDAESCTIRVNGLSDLLGSELEARTIVTIDSTSLHNKPWANLRFKNSRGEGRELVIKTKFGTGYRKEELE